MKLYISIPITGRPLIEARHHAESLKAKLSEHGHQCIMPFDICDDPTPHYAYYIETAPTNPTQHKRHFASCAKLQLGLTYVPRSRPTPPTQIIPIPPIIPISPIKNPTRMLHSRGKTLTTHSLGKVAQSAKTLILRKM